VAAGQVLVPVAVGAAVAGSVAVAVARPARARAAAQSVLILSTSVNGGSSSAEAAAVPAGDTVTVAAPSTWDAMSTAQFAAYSAIVIGDPSTSSCAAGVPSDALSTVAVWGAAVTGNVAVIGAAPAFAGTAGTALIKDSIAYALAGAGTGLYVSLNCEYAGAAAGTAVPLLAGVDGGGFTVTGQGSACPDAGAVNMQAAAGIAQFGGLSAGALGPWGTPACSVSETLNSWPAQFTGVGYDPAAGPADFTASDGATGQPYVLAGAPVSAATQALAPSTGGEVPAGATAGGANPAAPGAAQGSAGDPVNTENGDFTQSDTDVSVPGFGPGLDFTRTYDSGLAGQQATTGTPGPLGYGWTDNWASSLSAARPVPGDVYTLAGMATDDGQDGPAGSAVLNGPQGVAYHGGSLYIADTSGNRVLEVPGTSGTQWGQPMTAGDVYTIAGAGHGGPGAVLNHPQALAFDAAGDVYIADSWDNRIEEVAAAAGTQWGQPMTAGGMYTVAGSATGAHGTAGDGGPAAAGLLYGPGGIAVDAAGDLYIGDGGNNRVQEAAAVSGSQRGTAMTAGDVYTIAGGTWGSAGDGGPATAASLDGPEGVAVDAAGDVYVADSGNNRVQEIAGAGGTQWGQPMTAGDMYTIAGSATGAAGSSGDGQGAGGSLLDGPQAVAWASPNLYVADTVNNRVQEIAGAGGTQWGQPMTAGDVYTVAGSATGAGGYSGDGGPAAAATLSGPLAVALDGPGNLYIADAGSNRVRQVAVSSAVISTAAGNGAAAAQEGDGGPAAAGALRAPVQEAFDAQGDVFIADAGNNRIQEIAASSHAQFGITMTAGDVYTVAGNADGQAGCVCDGHPATQAYLNDPAGIVFDAAGDLYIADNGNNRIQEVPAASGTQWGQPMTAGYMYTVAGSAAGAAGNAGDGGPAAAAFLDRPVALALDKAGDMYIADSYNNRVQEVPAVSSTQWGQPMTAGDMYTVTGSAASAPGNSGDGGPAAAALLYGPGGVAVDAAGDVYIGDGGNNRVQEIAVASGSQRGQQMTAGDVYTIAGGVWGSAGDGGPAVAATLYGPEGVAVDAARDVYFADSGNNRVQEIAAASGTQWGQSMTAGDMYTVAGSAAGASGNSGDGGPAAAALMGTAESISLDPAGDMYITDNTGNRVREVASATAATIAPASRTGSGTSTSTTRAPARLAT
jgi:hypothetical protein